MKERAFPKWQVAKFSLVGEERIGNLFSQYHLPFEYRVLHDVSLVSNGHFQVDTMLLTAYFMVILESKNMKGTLSFESEPSRLVRKTLDVREAVFENPAVQVERNCYLFGDWLAERGVHMLIIGAIVLSGAINRWN